MIAVQDDRNKQAGRDVTTSSSPFARTRSQAAVLACYMSMLKASREAGTAQASAGDEADVSSTPRVASTPA